MNSYVTKELDMNRTEKELVKRPLEDLYALIGERIARIDFSVLWPGFSPLKFALYNEEQCFFDGRFVEKTSAFMANTSIQYEGENIAIWHVEQEMKEDADTLASLIVHEMFHAFQTDSGESRFANELEALQKYHYSEEALSLRYREGELMQKLLEEYDPETFEKLLAMRRVRRECFPYEYAFEAKNEQIEGSARFVELHALGQLNPEKEKKGWERVKKQLTDTGLFFPVRPATYASGACLLRILEEHYDKTNDGQGKKDLYAFTDTPFAVSCLERAHSAADEKRTADGANALAVNIPAVAKAYATYKQETRRMIDKALKENNVVLEGCYPLVSPNTYDAKFEKPYLTSRFFIAYLDGEEEKDLRGDFVIEMTEDFKIARIYRTTFDMPQHS